MNVRIKIAVDPVKLNEAMKRFPRDRAMWIDGREAAGEGETIERRSPAHGVVVTRVPRGRADDARRAIASARKAFDTGRWPHETASNRARVLLKVADLIGRDRETLAILDTLESGKPIAQARGEIEGAADIADRVAEASVRPGRRLRLRRQAKRDDVGVDAASRLASGRGRLAGGRLQHSHRLRP